MKRRLVIFAFAVSLLLCLGAILAWTCPRPEADTIGLEKVALTGRDGIHQTLYLRSSQGRLEIGRFAVQYPNVERPDRFRSLATTGWRPAVGMNLILRGSGLLRRNPPLWGRLGFGWESERWQTRNEDGTSIIVIGQHDALTVPWWLIVLLTALLPFIQSCRWLQRWRASRRRRLAGLCPTCGYDLRASKDCCPECGTPVPAKSVEKVAQ